MSKPFAETTFFLLAASSYRLVAIAQIEKLIPKRDFLKKQLTQARNRREKTESEFNNQFQKQRKKLAEACSQCELQISQLTSQKSIIDKELANLNRLVKNHLSGNLSDKENNRITQAVVSVIMPIENQLQQKQEEYSQTVVCLGQTEEKISNVEQKLREIEMVLSQLGAGNLSDEIENAIENTVENAVKEHANKEKRLRNEIVDCKTKICNLQSGIQGVETQLQKEMMELQFLKRKTNQKYESGSWTAPLARIASGLLQLLHCSKIAVLNKSITNVGEKLGTLRRNLNEQNKNLERLFENIELHTAKKDTLVADTRKEAFEQIQKKYQQEQEKNKSVFEQIREKQSQLRTDVSVLSKTIEDTERDIESKKRLTEETERQTIIDEAIEQQQKSQQEYDNIINKIGEVKNLLSENKEKLHIHIEHEQREYNNFLREPLNEEKQAAEDFQSLQVQIDKLIVGNNIDAALIESPQDLQYLKEQLQRLVPREAASVEHKPVVEQSQEIVVSTVEQFVTEPPIQQEITEEIKSKIETILPEESSEPLSEPIREILIKLLVLINESEVYHRIPVTQSALGQTRETLWQIIQSGQSESTTENAALQIIQGLKSWTIQNRTQTQSSFWRPDSWDRWTENEIGSTNESELFKTSLTNVLGTI
jgi:chromosome segregation ATPase